MLTYYLSPSESMETSPQHEHHHSIPASWGIQAQTSFQHSVTCCFICLCFYSYSFMWLGGWPYAKPAINRPLWRVCWHYAQPTVSCPLWRAGTMYHLLLVALCDVLKGSLGPFFPIHWPDLLDTLGEFVFEECKNLIHQFTRLPAQIF